VLFLETDAFEPSCETDIIQHGTERFPAASVSFKQYNETCQICGCLRYTDSQTLNIKALSVKE